MKKILITLKPSNCKSTVFLQYFLFFHPISNLHYLLLYSPFNILNSSQWLGVFLSNLVNLCTKYIHTIFSIELYCVLYFINYIYCELVTLWLSVMRKLYERCYRKFGYIWKIMTLNPKEEPHRTCLWRGQYILFTYCNKYVKLYSILKFL